MNLIRKYTKKPVTIEAIQFADDRDTISNIHGFLGMHNIRYCMFEKGREAYQVSGGVRERDIEGIPEVSRIEIETLEGTMTASVGDYIIKGVKGEFYPCKPDIFEATYSQAKQTGLTFGAAIEALKSGKRVARRGWNGKGMWLKLIPRNDWSVTIDHANDVVGLVGSPWIGMRTADHCFVPWLASQTDMLSDDWEILE